ncbi:MAG: hypothetical protein ABF629_11840 [Sporolactobacillus sp.]|uniref:hypothetical protein n=1 Tax=Sporolactobacillus sp. STSJ-5 TaxID=2965076 RepID=UPI002107AA89|nr:hypothetical protein [Sporolactobacillus sp. STSJ-5]MCQ2008751.1 hypothetical protein [Sporolactobacillus sp. STSJ-5]
MDDSNNKGAGFGSDKDGDKKRRQYKKPDAVPFCDDHVISELRVDGTTDEETVWLNAVIEWRPTGTIPLNRMSSLSASISICVPALIQIWRKDASGNTLITEKADSSSAIVIWNGPGGFILFNRVITTILIEDHIAPNKENEYVVTFTANQETPAGIHLDQSKVTSYQLFATLLKMDN